ncbi:MAG: tRNA (adenosine(37)-N6)-threonylcarbamoyltransferase complex ATPase subunit type 1 TsaE [Steroidobacterales bacterium]
MNLTLTDSGATEILGRALGESFPGAAEAAVVVYLNGELGAGKTSCARSLIHALGFDGTVRSPTYTLLETYALPGLTCVHADLYRLRSALELADLGLSEYLAAGHLILIEWSENGGRFVPPADLAVTLAYAGAGREATLTAGTAAGEAWLQMLAHDTRLIPYLSNLT